MADDFLAQVDQLFGFLEDAGFEVADRTVAGSFDNAYVSFRSADLLVGVGRERGHNYVEVGAPGTSRYDGQLLAELLDDKDSARASALERPRLDQLALFLERQLPALVAAFAPPRCERTVSALRRLGESRAEELFGIPGVVAQPPNDR